MVLENCSDNLLACRGVLAGLLADEARSQNPDGRVQIHFSASLIDLDLDARRASFDMPQSLDNAGHTSVGHTSSGSVEAKYDLLIGADGAGSR